MPAPPAVWPSSPTVTAMSSLTWDLTLAGLSVGSAAALTGVGLIVTYRATGVLNFAHGAIAMVCAYVLRQCVAGWGWPLWPSAALTLLVVAPGIGVLLERFVFRPLSVLGGDPAQTLVASIGVFVLLVGGAAVLWGQGARDDAPELLMSAQPWGQLGVVLALAVAVGAVTRWTRFGRELRAVVDDRRLAVLGGVDADRVAAAGWAFGSFTAGLTGVLLAPYVRLDPYGLPLLVMEVVAVAVAARMRSLPVAVAVALVVGVAQSQLTRLHPTGWGAPLVQAVGTNLFVVTLLVAALVLPGVGARDALPRAVTTRAVAPAGAWPVAVVLFLLPLGLAGSDLHTSVQVPALGVVLLSLVVVTGRGGQISLGQAAYAGLGALFTALLAAGRFPAVPALPELPALAVAVLLVAPLGVLTGWPAIHRHGLALALATFAVGVGVSRFVFAQPSVTAGLALERPAGFDGDRAYYVLELVLLSAALLAVRRLRQGRTGRALAALRDHEGGASAAGVPVPTLKLWAFVVGAALAALGGGLLGMGLRAFDPGAYDPVRGLLWFAAVVALGADSALGALAAAALLVGLDAGARGGVAAATVGVLAVLVGRLPQGPYETLRQTTRRLRPGPGSRLTPLGRATRRRLHRHRRPGPPGLIPVPAGATAYGTGDGGAGGGGRTGDGSGVTGGGAGRTGDGGGVTGGGAGRTGHGSGVTRGSGGRRGRTSGGGTACGADAGRTDGGGETSRAGGPADDPAPGSASGSAPGSASGSDAGSTSGPAPGSTSGSDAGSTSGPGPEAAPAPAAAVPPRGPLPEPGGSSPVLVARDLWLRYDGFTALAGVDLGVSPGRVTAVVGPNGAGKSSLFHCLAGTARPADGRVLYRGMDITRTPPHVRTRLGVARTFQQLAVFPTLTVADNVRVGAEQAGVPDPAAAVERTLRLLRLDGPLRTRPAAGLPTGALRRVELARALAGGPRVLLLDEPAAGLDDAEVAALARLLRALAADGVALLVVEHDLDLVAGLADVVHVMAAGRIVMSGPPGRVLAGGAP